MKKYLILIAILLLPTMAFPATRNSVGSGLWSAAGTWDTAPVDGDTVIITAGHTVTFDVDQNEYATGVIITVATGAPGGSLVASEVYGTYASCNDGTDTITVNETHGWLAGQRVVYRKNTSAAVITNLVDGTTYYILTPSGTDFQLESSIGGGAIDITGTAGDHTFEPIYNIKCAGHITVNADGSLLAGTSLVSPYPDQCVFHVNLNVAYHITGAGIVSLYASIPTTRYCLLSSPYTAASDDHIHVDFPTANQTRWDVGDEIRVINYPYITSLAITNQQGIISAIADNLITMAVTKPANNKESGSYVILVTHNVRITGGTNFSFINCSGPLTIGCEINHPLAGTTFHSCSNVVMSGVTHGGGYFSNGGYSTVSGIVSYSGGASNSNMTLLDLGLFVGNTYTYSQSSGGLMLGDTISNYRCGDSVLNLTISGRVLGVESGFNGATNSNFSGIIDASSIGVNGPNLCVFNGATFLNTATGALYNPASSIILSNVLMSGTEVAGLSANYPYNYISSFTHDQDTTQQKAWTLGGNTVLQYVTYPTGYIKAHQLTCSSATYWGFYQEELTIQPLQTITYVVYMRKSVSMAVKPKVEIVDLTSDPLRTSAGIALATDTYPTDDTATWKTLNVSYQNTGTQPLPVYFRVSGKNASGTVTFWPVPVLGHESW